MLDSRTGLEHSLRVHEVGRACASTRWRWRPAWPRTRGNWGEDESKWSVTALLHDFDWEIHPTLDGASATRASRFWPSAAWTRRSAAPSFRTPITPACRATPPLEKTLYRLRRAGRLHHRDFLRQAAPQRLRSGRGLGEEKDEGQGLRALGEPAGHRRGRAANLGVPLEEHIDFCVKAMQDRAAELGLAGFRGRRGRVNAPSDCPARRGEVRIEIRSRGACASEVCLSHAQERPPKKGGGAPKGAVVQAASADAAARHAIQMLPPGCASGARASRRSTAALATQINAMAQPRPCFLRLACGGGYPPSAVPVQRGTSRAGHSAGRSDARAARERGYKPRPREPHSPHQSAVTGDVPSMGEIRHR